MRLAALYRGEAGDARLHVAVDGGFAPVDELAAAARRPDLAGLRDVGDLYARGAGRVETAGNALLVLALFGDLAAANLLAGSQPRHALVGTALDANMAVDRFQFLGLRAQRRGRRLIQLGQRIHSRLAHG